MRAASESDRRLPGSAACLAPHPDCCAIRPLPAEERGEVRMHLDRRSGRSHIRESAPPPLHLDFDQPRTRLSDGFGHRLVKLVWVGDATAWHANALRSPNET